MAKLSNLSKWQLSKAPIYWDLLGPSSREKSGRRNRGGWRRVESVPYPRYRQSSEMVEQRGQDRANVASYCWTVPVSSANPALFVRLVCDSIGGHFAANESTTSLWAIKSPLCKHWALRVDGPGCITGQHLGHQRVVVPLQGGHGRARKNGPRPFPAVPRQSTNRGAGGGRSGWMGTTPRCCKASTRAGANAAVKAGPTRRMPGRITSREHESGGATKSTASVGNTGPGTLSILDNLSGSALRHRAWCHVIEPIWNCPNRRRPGRVRGPDRLQFLHGPSQGLPRRKKRRGRGHLRQGVPGDMGKISS